MRGGHWRPGARWAREEKPGLVRHAGETAALVTFQRDGNRDVIAAACSAARALGLAPRMPLAQARILVAGLDVLPADHEGDAAWLARLGRFAARRWTPRAALSGPDGLWLDLSGVAHLFGGERRMCERILGFCARLGMAARIAVAGTAGAAHALARFGAAPLILCPCGGEADALAQMPLAALRLEEDVLSRAHRLGLERIGELLAMPRAPLRRRFGAGLLTRLDQALGRAGEPFDPIVLHEPPSVTLRFLEPIATAEAIEEACAEAVRRLVPDLAKAGLAVRRLVLICDRVDNIEQTVIVSTVRATRDGAHLHRLLCAKIEKIEPGLGIERIRLIAARVEPLGPQPVAGELAGEKPAPDLAPLIDRLASRLGARRLYRLTALESDVPERSLARLGPLEEAAAWPGWPRPIRLLTPPEPVEQVVAFAARRPAPALHLARARLSRRRRRRPRTHLRRMVEARPRGASGPRLFPGRGRGRRPVLAVPQWRWRRSRHRRSGLAPARAVRMTYVELQVTSHFSFLRGVSSAEELFAAAAAFGYRALGVTDRNSVGGLVSALVAAERSGVRLVAGCRLDLMDGASLLVWPEDRAGWSRLTRLLTLGKSRADRRKGEKGQCFLHWEDVAAWGEGLVAALLPGEADDMAETALAQTADIFGENAHLALTHRRRPGEARRLHALDAMARRYALKSLATGDVLYDSPDKRMLQDVVTAIRNKCTIDDLGFRRERFADRHLKSAAEMERRFRAFPGAIRAGAGIAERCTFSLRHLSYQYPDEIVMSGRSPQEALERLTHAALAARFPEGPPKRYADLLESELKLVGKLGYAPYFLTVNSVVEFARSQDILCQGRGSAANSMICYMLGITSIDPVAHELLFARFISESRKEPPDIDVDFEHERREEVIQWIYETYGHDHAALTAVVSRYRSRGAIRDVGKALGLPEDVTASLAGQVWGWSNEGVAERHVDELGLERSDRLALALDLSRRLIGTPRHLSQHPGGFVLTRDRLDDLVPIEPAAMADRRVIEWEKDDIEELGLMKLDVLGLGMLGCMRRAFDLLAEHKQVRMTLWSDALQKDDEAVYEMIRKADTIGVFQIESRAQMSMLPRLKPREFYDLVIEVAIVRPGPIQGDMVHPYLRRREGREVPEYPKPELEAVLKKTLGVPLFQEQAMNVAMVAAGFSPTEADQLRRSMATFKHTGGVGGFRDKMVEGMVERGYTRDFAERTFRQIEGFGSYGFPESHAASFAKIAYASSWMKCHHPDIFCAALLNAQPMGFYAPAQLVRDAREHRVEIRPVCVNASRWDCTLEGGEGAYLPLRLGLRMVKGLANDHGALIVAARTEGPFASVDDVWRRSGVPAAALEKLADADAFHKLGRDRRQALWRVRGLGAAPLPLFAASESRENEPEVALRPLTAGREVVEDYRATQLSLRAHPLAFLRPELERRGILPCAALRTIKDGRKVHIAGIVLVRQRPGAGNVTFVTLEDESGIANAIIWQRVFEAQRRIVLCAAMVGIKGTLQREGQVIHVITDRLEDLTPLLHQVGAMHFPHRPGPADAAKHGGHDAREHPRRHAAAPPATRDGGLRIRSRDFH